MTLNLIIFVVIFNVFLCNSESNKRNIVFIVADDMGWNDVSFHGSDIQTPNIDALAGAGVTLHRYYTHSICTPSRAAIMTGKYAFKTGMQGYPLTNAESRGLPLTEKILPQYLKDLGYSTHLIGKWHLGHYKYAYLPTFRGFDSHYGHRVGFLDYYEYTSEENWELGDVSGFSLFNNVTPVWDAEGYITDLYTNEATNLIKKHDTKDPLFLMVCHNAPHAGDDAALLQAPHDDVRKLRYIELFGRRVYAAMVKKLDDSVGEIVEALNDRKMLNNTLVIFISDNGGPITGPTKNWSSNKPLRGSKMTAWEGGIRAIGTMWSMDIESNLWKGYFHGVDWLPTILGSIGVDAGSAIDGINLWNNIVQDRESERKEIVEIDDYSNYSAIVYENYKLVVDDRETHSHDVFNSPSYGTVIGKEPSLRDGIANSKTFLTLKTLFKDLNPDTVIMRNDKIDCRNKEFNGCVPSKGKDCLYNILEDPCEMEDVFTREPAIARELRSRLETHMNKTVPRPKVIRNVKGLPKYFNYTWASFEEHAEIYGNKTFDHFSCFLLDKISQATDLFLGHT